MAWETETGEIGVTDQSRLDADATVVVGTSAPLEDATVVVARTDGQVAVPRGGAGGTAEAQASGRPAAASVSSPEVAVTSLVSGSAMSWSSDRSSSVVTGSSVTVGLKSSTVAAPTPSRPLWLAVVLGVALGLALFAATALVILRS